MKLVYYYNENKEFTFCEEAQLDPLESELQGREIYLLPADATFTEPNQLRDGFVQIWEDECWKEVEDHRGKEYWLSGASYYDEPLIMTEIGPLPEGASLERPQKTDKEIADETLLNAKAERANYVSKIIVTVDDFPFDGDETSQDRMARSIVALNDGETVQWVLADNSIAQVTKEQLRQALRLAGEAQTAIWADPYIKSE